MRRWTLLLLVAGVAALLCGRWVSAIAADWAWYDAMGAVDVYRASLTNRVIWYGGAGGACFVFAFANLYALRRSIVSLVLPRRVANLEFGEAVPGGVMLAVVLAFAAIATLALTGMPGDWTVMAIARNATLFHEMDPYLDRDLYEAMTRIPFEVMVHDWAERVVLVVTIGIVALYALTPSLRIERGAMYISAWCRRHLAVLAAACIAILAWSARVDALTITAGGGATGDGFSAFDLHAGLPIATWRAALTGVAAFVVLWAGWNAHGRVAAIAGAVAALGGPLVTSAAPYVARRGLTTGEQADADMPFASTRRLFTRRAFGADEIVVESLPAASGPSRGALRAPAPIGATWDPAALLGAARGTRDAGDHGDGWTVASPVDPAVVGALVHRPSSPDAFHLKWFDADGVDERRHAVATAGPGTPGALDGVLVHDRAEGWRVVTDSLRAIAAPAFATRWERLVHAWRLRSPALALRDGGSPLDRIAYRRNVRERVAAITPFFAQGPTLSAMMRGDSLVWIVDLYATADWYPLSDRINFAGRSVSYVHVAGRAFVNAVTGRVRIVATARPDALTRTWMRRFPGLIERESPATADLAASAPPPVDWLAVQAAAFARTGFAEAGLAGREAVDNADAELAVPVPATYRGPDGRVAASVVLVDASGSVAGVVSASAADPRASWHPLASRPVWAHLLDQLQRSADSLIAPSARRSARRGRVLATAEAGHLSLWQSQYDWPADGSPALVAVVSARDDAVSARASTDQVRGVDGSGRGDSALRRAVAAIHRAMADALRRGDWVAFGAAFDALGRLSK